MLRNKLSAIAALVMALAGSSAHADYRGHDKAPALLENLRLNYGFSGEELEAVITALGEAQQLPQLVQAEIKAPEKTETWTQYSKRVDDARVKGGVKAIQQYPELFARAEAEFGVPAPVIAAIMGVETRYGAVTGKIRVLDALATQGFDHPTRTPFFSMELAEFFAFCRDFGYEPASLLGSYAGAMGVAQFMPSNYRRLALDYNGDGHRDLWNIEDAIGSIANYFVRYRPAQAWQRGQPLAVRATVNGELPAEIERNGKLPTHYAQTLIAAGVVPAVELPPMTPVGLIELPLEGGGKEYWLGLPNFYSAMTYNPRTFYAMAVTQLAQRIEIALAQQAAAPAAIAAPVPAP